MAKKGKKRERVRYKNLIKSQGQKGIFLQNKKLF